MSKIKKLPHRSKVKLQDTWDLSSLVKNDKVWLAEFKRWEKKISGYDKFRGNLGRNAKSLAACLEFDIEMDRLGDRLGNFAFLKTSEDQGNSDYQGMLARFYNAASRAGQAASYIRPEILSISSAKMKKLLASKDLAPHKLTLQRMVRYKKHTLGKKEEKLLAMQSEMSRAADTIFRQLNDADLKFGFVKDAKGQQVELSHAAFSSLLHSPKRSVRKTAFHQYYTQFQAHENTLAATLNASVQRDLYYAKARGYSSALEAALFHDKMPLAVYDNLIASVHRNLPALFRYYDLRRRKMKLKQIHQYDTYVPILSDLDTRRSWNQAVKLVIDALEPLGSQYCRVLAGGLKGRWCDRYENQGKQSGAFSCGSFDSDPYILMNYQPDVLNHVFTLAHEAGHSMHSYYSARHQPYQYYDYVIFVAEVASTFNEQLLSKYMMDRARSDQERAYLINRQIDAIRGTILRQTMFAEFEKATHQTAESGEPLTVESFKSIYHKLLEKYFGPDFTLDDCLPLECFRIPHFYRAFYVYKYATGLSAAIVLSERVLGGGKQELNEYLGFLQGGCSKYPLDLLRGAGVDMEKPQAVDAALAHFSALVDQLDALL